MKKLFFLATFSLVLLITPSVVSAQSMMGGSTESITDNHTASEEAEGKEIWEKLSRSQNRGSSTESGQSKQITCTDLTDENFGALGEYFMGQMMGDSHEAMNNMMIQMMGENGEEQMHIAMGKRMSACEPNAPLPQNMMSGGMMPMMMNMMMGSAFSRYPSGFGGTKGGGNPMMGYGWNNMMGVFGILGWIPMLLFWLLLILGVVALIRYLGRSGQHDSGKTPLEILKERYAKGEIDKKEFEQFKKDLS